MLTLQIPNKPPVRDLHSLCDLVDSWTKLPHDGNDVLALWKCAWQFCNDIYIANKMSAWLNIIAWQIPVPSSANDAFICLGSVQLFTCSMQIAMKTSLFISCCFLNQQFIALSFFLTYKCDIIVFSSTLFKMSISFPTLIIPSSVTFLCSYSGVTSF